MVKSVLQDFPGEAELLSVYFEESAADQYRRAKDSKNSRSNSGLTYDLELDETEADLVEHYEDDEDYE